MTEGQEVRASYGEVEGFVAKLREFHGSLDEGERAMMATILEGAQTGDTGGYALKAKRYEDPTEGEAGSESSSGWNNLVGWIDEQDGEDTQGFLAKAR